MISKHSSFTKRRVIWILALAASNLDLCMTKVKALNKMISTAII
jgi:hypothetical protein